MLFNVADTSKKEAFDCDFYSRRLGLFLTSCRLGRNPCWGKWNSSNRHIWSQTPNYRHKSRECLKTNDMTDEDDWGEIKDIWKDRGHLSSVCLRQHQHVLNYSSTSVITVRKPFCLLVLLLVGWFCFVYRAIKTAPVWESRNRSSAAIIWFHKAPSNLCFPPLLRRMKRDAAWLTEHRRHARQIGSDFPLSRLLPVNDVLLPTLV